MKTLIVGVLDCSSSMIPHAGATERGWEELLRGRASTDPTLASLYSFGSTVRKEYVYREADECPRYLVKCSGLTALLDAIGSAIDETDALLSHLAETDRPDKVLLAIFTDGGENASVDYSKIQVRDRVTHQRDVYSWEFLFQGANQDAVLTGGELGIPRETSLTYDVDRTSETYSTMSGMISRGNITGFYGYTPEERASVV